MARTFQTAMRLGSNGLIMKPQRVSIKKTKATKKTAAKSRISRVSVGAPIPKLNKGKAPRKTIAAVKSPMGALRKIKAGPLYKAVKRTPKSKSIVEPKLSKTDQKPEQKKAISDQKQLPSNINDCCMFCNNRMVLEAVRNNDVPQVKQLLNDYDHITNPFQAYSFDNKDVTPLSLMGKNKDMIKLFIKELTSKKIRKDIDRTLLSRFEGGDQGRFNFNIHIKPIQQGRGSKEGNDAFVNDDILRNKYRPKKIIKEQLLTIDFLKELLEGEGEIKKKRERYFWFQDRVIDYVRAGMIYEAKYLIQHDFENEISDFNKLYAAALGGDIPDRILRISVCKTSHIHNLLSPLHCACINPNLNILKSYLKICPTFSLPDKNRRNLIHYAAANQNSDIIKFLIANGCDANELDAQRKTPLMIACDLGRIQNVQALLEHFDKKSKNKKEEKLPKGKKSKKDDSDEDMDGYGDEGLDNDFDVDFINFKDRSSRTALQYAAYSGHVKIIEALIDAGAEVETKNSKSITPILNAASRGHLEALKVLHSKGGNLQGKIHKQRKSALILASANGHTHIVEYLLSNELSSYKEADTSGNTALHYAAAYGWPAIVKLLLKAGADPNLQNLWNTTPASLAIQKCHYQILDIILNNAPQIGDDKQPFLSDANGRDLVSQHLLKFDKNTVDHFQTLTALFKRLGIKPHDSSDSGGFNAFHYLCGFQPVSISKKLARKDKQEEEEEDEEENEDNEDDEEDNQKVKKGKKKGKKIEVEDEDMDELTKEEKEHLSKYKEVCDQILHIAKTLEHWGYNYEAVSLDGHSPFSLAIQCQNIPMIQWLLAKNPKINIIEFSEIKRNFLHFLCGFLINFNFLLSKFNSQDLLDQIYRKYSHSDDLFNMAQLQDARGLTPFLYALNIALAKVYRNDLDEKSAGLLHQRILEIVAFLTKIGHKLEEHVPQERKYFFKNNQYKDPQEIDCETDTNLRFNKFNTVYYGEAKPKFNDTQAFKELGMLDLRLQKKRKTNFFVHYNWLHFLSQIIVLTQKITDTAPLINLIVNYGKQGNAEILKKQILEQTQYMESVLTMSYYYEPLFRVLLNYLEPKCLKESIVGLYEGGAPCYVHLMSYIKSQQGVEFVINLLKKDKTLQNQKDTLGNTLLHYAAYFRNATLLEALLKNFGPQLFKEDPIQANSLGNTPLHLTVAIKRKNQLELPRIEEQLMQNCSKQGDIILHQNFDGLNPLMMAIKKGSESENDPVNVVKLMLESPFGSKMLNATDKLGNTTLHLAAKLDSIPLSLSIIFAKTSLTMRNVPNNFGNAPLSEAIINEKMNNALFILQTSNDIHQIQEQVTLYKSKFEAFQSKHGIIIESMKQVSDITTDDYIIQEKENAHKLALQKNFFGLYHFSDARNSPLPILIGALQAKNFILFNQLLDNYSAEVISSVNQIDGRTLLHALASTVPKVEEIETVDSDEENEEEDEDEEMEEEEVEDESGDPVEDQLPLMKEIYGKLTKQYKLKLDSVDKSGMTSMQIAAKSKNYQFIELAMKDLEKADKSKIAALLNLKSQKASSFISLVMRSQVNASEVFQLKVLKLLKKRLGNDQNKLDFNYTLERSEIVNEAKGAFFQKTLRETIYFDQEKKNLWPLQISSLFDLVQNSRRKVISYLLKHGISFKVQENMKDTTPFIWACLMKDLKTIKIMVDEGKITLDKQQEEKAVKYLRSPGSFDDCWSYSTQIEKYLFEKGVFKFTKKVSTPFDYMTKAKPVIIEKPHDLKKMEEQTDLNFNQALQKFNGQRKFSEDKPELIDEVSEMQDTHEVHVLDQLQTAILMMKVDIARGGYHGTMRYYILQLLKEKKTGQLTLWTRWGRIGDRGQNQKTPFKFDEVAAVKEFKKILKQKSNTTWEAIAADPNHKPEYVQNKYRIVQLGNHKADKRIFSAYQSLTRVINVNYIVKALEDDLVAPENQNQLAVNTLIKNSVLKVVGKYFDQVSQSMKRYNSANCESKIMNMALTSEQISEAYDVLMQIKDNVTKAKEFGKKGKNEEAKTLFNKVVELNNAYYSLIPTKDFSYSAAKELIDKYTIDTEIDFLKEIYDFGRAFKISMASIIQKNPLNYVKQMLPIKLQQLSCQGDIRQNQEYANIMTYLNNSLYGQKEKLKSDFVVSNIFKLSDNDLHQSKEDNEVFSNLHNHYMLWHGTKNENLMSILLKGLKIKPPNADHNGSLFGKAIYFSDQSSKAIDYTSATTNYWDKSTKVDNFYLLLCEVACGNIANYSSQWEGDCYRPPENHHSVRIMSSQGPDFAQNIINSQNQVYPIGPLTKYPKPQFAKGTKHYKSSAKFFAEYLKNKKDQEKAQSGKKKKKATNDDVDMSSDHEDLEQDEEEDLPEDSLKRLEASFTRIPTKTFELQPEVINADYCMKRLVRDTENFDEDSVYADVSQYMVYSEKQVRIRYMVEFKKIQGEDKK